MQFDNSGVNAYADNKKIILASGSPRRRELLAKMGYSFETCTPDVDERVSGNACEIVGILAERKAQAACEMYDEGIIIASDTLVSLDGTPLGKPEDIQDARRMLKALSGREHEVFTGVCIRDAASGKSHTEVVRTGVRFRNLSDEDIDVYIATGEPMDKAGAYAIQGGAGKFVESFDGSFENVVGFPVDEVRRILSLFGK